MGRKSNMENLPMVFLLLVRSNLMIMKHFLSLLLVGILLSPGVLKAQNPNRVIEILGKITNCGEPLPDHPLLLEVKSDSMLWAIDTTFTGPEGRFDFRWELSPNFTSGYIGVTTLVEGEIISRTVEIAPNQNEIEIAIGVCIEDDDREDECKARFQLDYLGDQTMEFYARQYDSTAHNAVSYFWEFGDGITGNGPVTTHRYDSPGEYEVCLTVVDSLNECEDKKCKRVYVPEDSLGCRAYMIHKFLDEQKVAFLGVAGPWASNDTEFFWNFGDGTTETGQEVIHEYEDPGEYEVCVTVVDSSNDCEAQYCKTIRIGNRPECEVDFVYEQVDQRTFEFLAVADSGASTDAEYYWIFGDGNRETGIETKHTFNRSGRFRVCLVLVDSTTACYAQVCKEVWVEGNDSTDCWVGFEYDTDGLVAEFEAFSNIEIEHIATAYWDFGDGNEATGEEVRHEYDQPGVYKVCVVLVDTIRGCEAEYCKEIRVGNGNGDCTAKFSYERVDEYAYKFRPRYLSNTAIYEWSINDSLAGNDDGLRYEFPGPGEYEVCLWITDSTQNCVDNYCKVVEIRGRDCQVAFEYDTDDDEWVAEFEVLSSIDIAPNAEIIWYFGDGETGSGEEVRHEYAQAGRYEVCVVLIDSTQDCVAEYCKTIRVGDDNSQNCTAKFYWEGFDNGVVAFYPRYESNTALYEWFVNDSLSSTDYDFRYEFAAGEYDICLVVTDTARECVDEYCKEIRIEGNQHDDCTAKFYAERAGNGVVEFWPRYESNTAFYQWYVNDSLSSTDYDFRYEFSEGVYNVCLVVTDTTRECFDEYCKEIQIGDPPRDSCEVSFEYGLLDSTTVQFEVISDLPSSNPVLLWYFGDGTVGSGPAPVHEYRRSGTYDVCVTAIDSSLACIAAMCMRICVGVEDSTCGSGFGGSVNNPRAVLYQLGGAIRGYVQQLHDDHWDLVRDILDSHGFYFLDHDEIPWGRSVLRATYQRGPSGPSFSPTQFSELALDVFPNPTLDRFTVRLAGGSGVQVQITDILGKVWQRHVWPNGKQEAEFSLQQAPEGIYILQIQTDKGIITHRIIKRL